MNWKEINEQAVARAFAFHWALSNFARENGLRLRSVFKNPDCDKLHSYRVIDDMVHLYETYETNDGVDIYTSVVPLPVFLGHVTPEEWVSENATLLHEESAKIEAERESRRRESIERIERIEREQYERLREKFGHE